MINIELTVDDNNRDKCGKDIIAIGDFVLATAGAKDNGAKLADGVIMINGAFTSAGKYRCVIVGIRATVRCTVPADVYARLQSIDCNLKVMA